MTAPKRIQRRRVKGWRMPEGAVYVGRNSVYGNPFKVIAGVTPEQAVDSFRELMDQRLRGSIGYIWRVRLERLRGHDLACWCGEDAEFCHADVLLDLANKETP